MAVDAAYRCPGESYEISRSVHLGRLASFYPACGSCPHRSDLTSFSKRRARLINERRHEGESSLVHGEGLSGAFLNELGPDIARRIGQAMGIHAAQSLITHREGTGLAASDAGTGPRILIAHDGRPSSAELAAAAVDGLRWANCATAEVGATTAPCLVLAAECDEADGAILVGNPSGDARQVGLTLWSARGEPMSSPGTLDPVRDLFHSPAPRPHFVQNGHERLQFADRYLAQLEPHYHALRPLRIVLNSTSPALLNYLERLTRDVSIEIDRGLGGQPPGDANSEKNETRHRLGERLERIAGRVRAIQAHFGIWIDGDGERCRVIDESGELVSVKSLAALFVREVLSGQPEARMVLPPQFVEMMRIARHAPAQVIPAAKTRQEIWLAVRQQRAELAADATGRFWFVGEPTCADALKALTVLLSLLSRSDSPLSELIASAIL